MLALAICLGLFAGCTPEAPRARALQGSRTAFRHVPIGLGEDYPETTRSLAVARRDLELLHTNGLHVLRVSFSWAEIEPEPGRYDWEFWDRFVALATDQYGLRLIPYICYTPRWAAAGAEETWRQPPRDNAQFAGFVRQVVRRYHLRIHSWEIWNEPDNPEYWTGSVEQYETLLEAGSAAVKESDPTAKVVMGGLAWNLNFLEAMLTNSAVLRNVDVVNLHNYYETWSSEPLERLPEYIGRAHDLLTMYHRPLPLWTAEVGYSNFRQPGYQPGHFASFYRYEHTPEHQAASLFKLLTLVLASGDVSLVTWYRINDLPATQEIIGDSNNRFLGVLGSKGQVKPALASLAHFHALFDEGFRCLDSEVRITRTNHSDAEVHVFARPDGSVILIGWLRTVVTGRRGAVAGQVADRRRETVDVLLPQATQKMAVIWDATGRRLQALPVRVKHHTTLISGLELADGGVKVVRLDKANLPLYPLKNGDKGPVVRRGAPSQSHSMPAPEEAHQDND